MKKADMSDIKFVKSRIRRLEDLITDLFEAPSYKKSKIVKDIRDIQDEIESRLQYISSHLQLSSTKIKFNFETVSRSYRSKQGKYEKSINKALFNRGVEKKVLSGNSERINSNVKQNKDTKKSNKSEQDKIDKKLDHLFKKIDMDENRSKKYKSKIKNKLSKIDQNKLKNYKVKFKVNYKDKTKPTIKVKLVKKDG